jgi:peptidoglycan/LPS O-acetylase OafA/YrhL
MRYLPGLNTLRLYAALCVVVAHIESYGWYFIQHDALRPIAHYFTLSAQDAVTLFFVLSGYLITYLLLLERRETGDIHALHFYFRRSLRIFPLYYLFLIVTVLVVSSKTIPLPPNYAVDSEPMTWLTILFFSSHIPAAFANLGFMNHLWSIGVEEWFYLAWGALVKRVNLLVLIGAILVGRLIIITILAPQALFAAHPDALSTFLKYTRFECMAMGALGAWLVHTQHPGLRWVYRLERVALLLMLLLIVLPIGEDGGAIFHLAISVLFMFLIVNVSTNKQAVVTLEHPVLSRWGNITYGVYMWHPFTIYFVSAIFSIFAGGWIANFALYIAILAVTLLVARVSYDLYETPFLKLKSRGAPKLRTEVAEAASVPN